jgi:hypothetical protein
LIYRLFNDNEESKVYEEGERAEWRELGSDQDGYFGI